MKILPINDVLKDMLQRDVQFAVNGKVIKEGKIMVFNVKDFYISFVLTTKKGQNKTYEIPVPFDIRQQNTTLFLDYRLNKIHRNSPITKHLITCISKSIGKKSKFFDNVMVIRVKDDSNK